MIWKKKINLNNINNSMKNTMAEYLQINIEEVGDNFIRASMPVNEKTIQPFGILHGGASVVLAETVGSVASNLCLNDDQYSVGLDINANHIKSVRDNLVEAITKPIHIGRTTHVWEIKITQREKLTCLSRLTTVVLDR
jgi:1,4-dihydroxy-2-naphthoyl-CoA hydrolase|tara:strand:- start:29 stop:442 length:414 start_codon:yes stop_codon:yes gene_type:complete